MWRINKLDCVAKRILPQLSQEVITTSPNISPAEIVMVGFPFLFIYSAEAFLAKISSPSLPAASFPRGSEETQI